jgi:hypothetical protein
MDQTEGLKREGNYIYDIGNRTFGKRYRMNQLAVAGVNTGKTVAIMLREGIVSFKPFGDYVEIKFSQHE